MLPEPHLKMVAGIEPVIERRCGFRRFQLLPDAVIGEFGAKKDFRLPFDFFRLALQIANLRQIAFVIFREVIMIRQRNHLDAVCNRLCRDGVNQHIRTGTARKRRVNVQVIPRQLVQIVDRCLVNLHRFISFSSLVMIPHSARFVKPLFDGHAFGQIAHRRHSRGRRPYNRHKAEPG